MDKKVELTDVELVKKFKKGSLEAFEEIIRRYEAKVMQLGMRLTRNHEDAEEVMQDVFSTIYKKIDSFQGKSAFSSWLYRIVVNAAFMKLRKRKQSPTVALEDLAPTIKQSCLEGENSHFERSDTIASSKEMREVIQLAINKLPRQYRAVFVLRDVDGLSNNEVGEILQLSIPAVKSRLHRSRLMLRKKLQRYYDDYTDIKPMVRITQDRINNTQNRMAQAA
jgi:RNA polymerase sigma-70 factor (ECF subfamily)